MYDKQVQLSGLSTLMMEMAMFMQETRLEETLKRFYGKYEVDQDLNDIRFSFEIAKEGLYDVLKEFTANLIIRPD